MYLVNSINEATATLQAENVFKFGIAGNTIVEIVLNEDSISGTFVVGQNITGTANDDEDVLVTATLSGIIVTKTIGNDGGGYSSMCCCNYRWWYWCKYSS